MMAKNIRFTIMCWKRPIWHEETWLDDKTPSAPVVGDLHPKMSRKRSGVAFALLLGTGLLSLPVVGRAQASTADDLRSTSRTIEQLADELNPAVVEIDVKAWEIEGTEDQPERAGYLVNGSCLGTGILLTSTGEILTNHHVVRGSQQITVHLQGSSKEYNAKIIGDDPDADLTLLKVEASGLPHFELEASHPVRQGQIVLAIGNPYGFGHSITLGVVSSPSRELDEDMPTTYIQTDTPINPGNSGGPLIDLDGHLVGINTLILSYSGGSEGLGFAIPIDTVMRSVAAMETYGSVKRPYLGVSLQLVTAQIANGLRLAANNGILVNDIDYGSPASKSGIEPGDVILSIEGKATPDWKSLQAALDSLHFGQSAVITVERKRIQQSITVKPQYNESRRLEILDYANVAKDFVDQLGIVGVALNTTVRNLFPATRLPGGVVVAAKCNGIHYDTDGLQANDILHQVNGHDIHNVEDLRSYLQTVPREPLIFQVEREDHLMYIAVASRD